MVLCCEGADVHSSPVLNPRQAAASEDERTSSRQGRVSFQTSSEKARAESEAGVVARSSLLMWPLLLVIAGTTLPLASDDEVKKSHIKCLDICMDYLMKIKFIYKIFCMDEL